MYDIIIIGCGPAGMSAAIYSKRANKNVLVLEGESIGGQMASAPIIENYPGYRSIRGSALADVMFGSLLELNVEIELETALKVIPQDRFFEVVTESNRYKSRAVIIAVGAKYRTLNIPSEDKFLGKGIHFCVTCDGAFYKNKTVAIIGGGRSAVVNALMLADICNKVYLIHRRDKLNAEENMLNSLSKCKTVEIVLNSTVESYNGKDSIEAITLTSDMGKRELKVDGIFLSVGSDPATSLVTSVVKCDKDGFIETDETETNIEGLYAVGDCRQKKYRQVTIAVADGTNAALKAIEYLNNN